MAVNITPIFSKSGIIKWTPAPLTAANTAKDGTGTVAEVVVAAADGFHIQRLVARSLGTNVVTVLRVFVNNGLTNATPANNSLIAEATLPATTLSEAAAQPPYELPMNFVLPAGHKLICTLGTAVAAGYAITVFGGNYTA